MTLPEFAGPESVTLSVTGGGADVLNVAVTAVLPVNVTWQVPVPLQAPLQPANVEFVPGVAVSVTLVPEAKFALQTVPQLIPEGLLVTVPVPLPANETISDFSGVDFGANVAVTDTFAVNITVQVLVPLQAPPHPTKVEFAEGFAVSVTFVPD